jgi:predicted nucleic acid-binding protein
MPKKIFFDANILIDFIYSTNTLNKEIAFLFYQLRRENHFFYCSPTSFAITYYFLSKKIENINLLNKKAISFFSEFKFTREDHLIMEEVKRSKFRDLEDGLQYFSAEDSKVDLIITKNFFDFEHSLIPVYHPEQYISEFLL